MTGSSRRTSVPGIVSTAAVRNGNRYGSFHAEISTVRRNNRFIRCRDGNFIVCFCYLTVNSLFVFTYRFYGIGFIIFIQFHRFCVSQSAFFWI